MKTFKIFHNTNKKSFDVAAELRGKLVATGKFREAQDGEAEAEYVLSVGGDGRFLKSLRDCLVSDKVKFVGINTGTLGFLQSVEPNGIDDLVTRLAQGTYKVQELSFIKCSVICEEGFSQVMHGLNELVIRAENLHILNLKIKIDGEELETYAGDGVLVATSTGSTAYNLSIGGSIVHETFHTLQLTPVAPLTTTVHSLQNPIVMPDGTLIEISPVKKSQDLLFSIDGYNSVVRDVRCLQIELDKRRVNRIIVDEQNFWSKISEKILRRGN